MRRCLLRWQDERLFSTFRPRSSYLPGFSFNPRFPRMPTSVCVTMDKFPGAQNFSVSPKKPLALQVPLHFLAGKRDGLLAGFLLDFPPCLGTHSFESADVAAVGTPVTRRPPHSPGRAVCPHPVLRLDSLPRKTRTQAYTRRRRGSVRRGRSMGMASSSWLKR